MLSVMLGPTLGGTVANMFGLRAPLWFGAGISLLGLICATVYIVNPEEIVYKLRRDVQTGKHIGTQKFNIVTSLQAILYTYVSCFGEFTFCLLCRQFSFVLLKKVMAILPLIVVDSIRR